MAGVTGWKRGSSTVTERGSDYAGQMAEMGEWKREGYCIWLNHNSGKEIRMEKNEVLKSLESLMKHIESGKIHVFAHQEAAIREVVKEYHTGESPMAAYHQLEDWMHKQTEKPVSIISAMAWGGLTVIRNMGCIDWDTMRSLYGEFMSKQMDLR